MSGTQSGGSRGSNSGKRVGSRGPAAASSNSLYERYKDALRRGHVAALRGRFDAAVDAYGEAATIAPDRALPHVSVGGILVKMGRMVDAVPAYQRALDLAPRDEMALRGMADAQTRLGRRTAAGATLDRLADTLEAAGRLADATDAARRALELAESRARRTQVESLVERLRIASPSDESAMRALDQALRLLEPPSAPAEVAAEASAGSPDEGAAATEGAEATPPADEPVDVTTVEATATGPVGLTDAAAADVAAAAADVDAAAEVLDETTPGPRSAEADATREAAGPTQLADGAVEPVGDAAGADTTEEPLVEPIGLGIALGAAAEAELYAGNLQAAHEGLLAAARAHRRAGRLVAAVDACDLAIGLAPADPELHLLLAELYVDRGWRTLAADKILLLGRLADLDGDRAVRDRLCALVAARLADEPRLAELCA